MSERILTLRDLNRATLARQQLLERKRLSPTALIERLVGMQAQWPPAPYVGIWTRTMGFRCETLERALASGSVVKATVMRQTLHLVTPRDYALIRAAMSEANFPWETSQAKSLASVARALAAEGPVTSAEGIAALERETRPHGDRRPACLARRPSSGAPRAPPRDRPLARSTRGPLRRARRAGGARPDRGSRRDSAPLPRRLRAGIGARHRVSGA